MAELIWWIFASLAVGGGVSMVAARSPVASLLSLVMTLFSIAVLFVLLEAHFIAAIQVIVYAGAIMVLFLFVIMLLNLGHDYRSDMRSGAWIVVGFGSTGVLGWLLTRTLTSATPREVPGIRAIQEGNAVAAIAGPLFDEYVVAFELTSLLLLVAIIGAILLAKRRV